MKIVKKVLIKQIVTENSKEALRESFGKQKMQLEQECQQLLFEQRKLQNKLGSSRREIKDRFEKEINERKEEISLIDFKIEQLDMLELGSEIIEGEVEALVEVSEGLSWSAQMKESSIVIKDDIIIRIER